MDETSAKILSALAEDFASELDLHYEVADKELITESIQHIRDAVVLLEDYGYEVPDVCLYIIRRFENGT